MATPHISAEKGDFAKTVLMPGDPLRAKFIADTFLQDVRQVTGVSGQLLGHDFQLLQVGAPGLVRGVEILNGPLVGLSNLTALEYFFRF